VTSIDWMLSLHSAPVATAVSGVVTNAAGARATLVGAGSIGVLVCLAFLARFGAKLEPAGERTEA
jgi:hypothetical protein